ncbi:hypothetical protein GYMLUDRAFT_252388 [Collybiopsis luxurians FD-317 M1]|uniref:Uncharacterized protein n=1 Tax=Collybiopsis luxurians FD-317 M1 TaxID=944289 RepID=A0A0D0C8L6_9AGAR|nr:hypothetical protein GYMLUDRAFT_252388 [Collybiopsis luxurians FD-317 M1]
MTMRILHHLLLVVISHLVPHQSSVTSLFLAPYTLLLSHPAALEPPQILEVQGLCLLILDLFLKMPVVWGLLSPLIMKPFLILNTHLHFPRLIQCIQIILTPNSTITAVHLHLVEH